MYALKTRAQFVDAVPERIGNRAGVARGPAVPASRDTEGISGQPLPEATSTIHGRVLCRPLYRRSPPSAARINVRMKANIRQRPIVHASWRSVSDVDGTRRSGVRQAVGGRSVLLVDARRQPDETGGLLPNGLAGASG